MPTPALDGALCHAMHGLLPMLQDGAPAAADGPGLLGSLVLGVVEGLTEFLPVSSTGHLIVTNRLLGHDDPTYEVAIQAGAITAIVALYWARLFRATAQVFRPAARSGPNLLLLIVLAALPAAVVGIALEDVIDRYLFGTKVVATSMIVGGVLLLLLERWFARRGGEAAAGRGRPLEAMTIRDALSIGAFQCLALIPGASRSASTIAGGMLLGLERRAAAEFSFLVGLPILYGACALKTMKDWERISGPLLVDFLIGAGASFVTALLIVGPFVRYLERHTFAVFAWYRIAAGLALLALIAGGVV